MTYRLSQLTLIILIALMHSTVNAKTYYISNKGSDTNAGTLNSPFRTISKGAELAQAGDTVYVFEGVYRERVSPPRGGVSGKPIVYLAEKNRNVVIKGSDIWQPAWKKSATNVYYAVPDDALFTDDCYKDNKNPFKVASSSTPYGREGRAEVVNFGYPGDTTIVYTLGQVFVDGRMYIQKPFLSEMNATANTWFYDRATDNLYIHFPGDNPNNYTVEITTRRRIFAPHKRKLGYINVEGFVMEHCGNQYPANFWETNHPEWQQAGALGTRSGNHWVIRNNMIRFANSIGIDFGNEGASTADIEVGSNGSASGSAYHIIDSNYICDNGAAGTAAYLPANITFTNNVIERNVNLMFTGNKRWESAAVKMHGPKNSLIANNLLRNNYMSMNMWFDQGAGPGTRVHGNLMIGCEKGFFQEIGIGAENKIVVDNNIIVTRKYGITTRNSGGITAMHNLISGPTVWGVYDYIDKTRTGCSSDFQLYYNNVLLNCTGLIDAYPPDIYNVAPYNYQSSDRRYDYNLYQAVAADKKFKIETVSSVSFSDWQTKWQSYNSSLNCDLNSKLTSTACVIDTTKLLLLINAGSDYLTSRTFAHASMDKDFLGNTLKNDGTAIPGPIQNLKSGINQISLWNGLPLLPIYAYPYSNTTHVETVKAMDENLLIQINNQAKSIEFSWTTNQSGNRCDVSLIDLNGKELLRKRFQTNNQPVVQGTLNLKSCSPNVYLLRFSTANKSVSKKIILR